MGKSRRSLLADAALVVPVAALAPVLLARHGVARQSVRLPEHAPPATFLLDARRAILAGRIGGATEALERAESRVLQAIAISRATAGPSTDPLVLRLADARRALAAGDRRTALGSIDDVLAHIPPRRERGT